MSIQSFYSKIGGDYESAVKFMMDDEIIKKFVLKFKDEPTFKQLKDSISTKTKEEIFKISHTLKGICLNLSFSKLSKNVITLTDSLREGARDKTSQEQIQDLFNKIEANYNEIISAINTEIC